MRNKFKFILLGFLFLSACSHMRSGHYVMNENGEWEFIPSNTGIAQLFRSNESYGVWDGGEFTWPVPSNRSISSGYGERWGRPHHGIDIPGNSGEAVIAADDGVVVYASNRIRGYGNMVIVDHGSHIRTVYAHNRKNLVRKGQRVERGQLIARVGKTGKASGNHLHFEVRNRETPLDPMKYFRRPVRSLASRK
ncbi:MAG: M23 family metallopeptidase [Bacteriovoracaceae bacterium]|nr:M23 family metallopeptidase [Bacteriovoracaceae bacterium]